MSEPERLYAKKLPTLVHACESRRHIDHPGLTCEQADDQIAQEEAFWKKYWSKQYAAAFQTPMCDVPPALRGPNWKGHP